MIKQWKNALIKNYLKMSSVCIILAITEVIDFISDPLVYFLYIASKEKIFLI